MADYTQGIAYRELPDGSLEARLELSFPNGAKRVFVERLTAADGAEVALGLVRSSGVSVGAYLRNEVGAAAGKHPSEVWWALGEAKRRGKRVDDRKALTDWYGSIGRGGRSTVRALVAESPPGTFAQKLAWWEKLGKKRRGKARERHGGEGGGLLSDAVNVVKSIDRAIDKSPLGKAAQIALPALAVGRWSFKNPAQAAAFIPGGSAAATAIKQGVALMPAAKKLAAGKVMEAAAKGIEAQGVSPVSAGAARALRVASRLEVADAARDLGVPDAARKLVNKAKAQLAGVSPALKREVYAQANATRRNVAKLATGKAAAPSQIRAAAKRGAVYSNKPSPVSQAELSKAFGAGRVFVVRG